MNMIFVVTIKQFMENLTLWNTVSSMYGYAMVIIIYLLWIYIFYMSAHSKQQWATVS